MNISGKAKGSDMKPFERIALAHIAQELLWDPGLIPLASFNARQRAGVMQMLRRMAGEESAIPGGKRSRSPGSA